MSFLAPWMLAGLAAASLPVIIHFFYRSRYRTVPWAAMKFLLTSVEQTSRRLKFQELLLLIARTTLLVLLALALARPSTRYRSSGADGDSVDAVFLIDTSLSMGARDGSMTRLERARAAALTVIDHLPPRSTVQVVAVTDRAENLGPVASSDLEQAREVVRTVELTHRMTDLLPGVAEAQAALERGHSPNKELYLFSDMQQTGWDGQAASLTAKLKEVGARASVTLARCGTRTPKNVSLMGLQPQSGIPHAGERAGFALLVRNSGRDPVRDLTVTLEVDGRSKEKESVAVPVIAPGETQAVTLSAKLEKAGRSVLSASVGPDELDADNGYMKVLQVREQTRTLVVDGSLPGARPDASASFYLMHSLRPVPESSWGTYHIRPRRVSPAEASPAYLGEADVCILVDVDLAQLQPGFTERLGRFVKEGRGLLVFGGPRVSPAAYSRALFEEQGLLPFRLTGPETVAARPDPGSIDPLSFLASFREEPLGRIGQANVYQRLGAEDGDVSGARTLVRYADGRPLLAVRTAGSGKTLLVTTSADGKWTDFPLRHTYLPFVHVAMSHLLEGRSQGYNLRAGEPLEWRPSVVDANKVFTAIDPLQNRIRLGAPSLVDGRPILTLANVDRAGLYRILPEAATSETDGAIFAAAPDLRECESLEALTDAQIDERLAFKVHHLTAGDDLSAFAGGERLRREWTFWLLLAMLAVAAFEAALAWYCGRGW